MQATRVALAQKEGSLLNWIHQSQLTRLWMTASICHYLSLSVILSVKSLNTGKHADSRLDPPQPWGRESVANTGNGGHIQGHPHGSPHKWRPGPCKCEPHQFQNPSDRYLLFWAESWTRIQRRTLVTSRMRSSGALPLERTPICCRKLAAVRRSLQHEVVEMCWNIII